MNLLIDALLKIPTLKAFLNIENTTSTNQTGLINNSGKGNVNITIKLDAEGLKELKAEDLSKMSALFARHSPEFLVGEQSTKKKESLLIESKNLVGDNLIEFISQHIPKSDVSMWILALRLKDSKINKNPELVRGIKEDLRHFNKDKGINIANLCSSDYLEDEIIPTFESIPDEDKKDVFIAYYENLVTKLYKSIFVSRSSRPDTLLSEIKDKLSDAKKYGLEDVRIHALGSLNIDTLDQALYVLKKDSNYVISNDESPKHVRNIRILIPLT